MVSRDDLSFYKQFLTLIPQLQALGVDTQTLNLQIGHYIDNDEATDINTRHDNLYVFMLGLGFEFDAEDKLTGFSKGEIIPAIATDALPATCNNDQNLSVKLIKTDEILPPGIDPLDIFPNGTLFDDDNLKKANQLLGTGNDCRIDKAESGLNYTLMRLSGRNYAVYKGGEAALGNGSFGKVKYLIDLETGKICVLKAFTDPHTLKKHVEKEVSYLKLLEKSKGDFIRPKKIQPKIDGNISKQFAHFFTSMFTSTTTPSKYFIAMDLESGVSLAKMDFNKLSFLHLIKLFKGIILAAKEFNEHNLLHRDIKPENLIYDPATGKVKLIDFGFVTACPKGTVKKSKKIKGTPGFAAPEIVTCGYYSEKTEVFAIGQTFNSILYEASYEQVPSEFITLILQMIKQKSKDRLNLDEAFNYLDNLENNYLNISNKLKDIGFVCAQEIVDKQGELKEGLIQSLSLLDQVWLINNPQQVNNISTSSKPTSKLVYELLEKGIKVAGVLEVKCSAEKFNPVEIVAAAKDMLEKNNDAGNINIYSYSTLQDISASSLAFLGKQSIAVSNQNNASIKITPNHFQLIKNKLTGEIEEIDKKLKTSDVFTLADKLQYRRDKIAEFLVKLDEKNIDLTYQELKQMLNDAAKEMHHVHKYRYWFNGFFKTKQTNTAKKLIKFAEQSLKTPDSESIPNKITIAAPCA